MHPNIIVLVLFSLYDQYHMVYYIIKYKGLECTMTILYTFFSLIIVQVAYISNMLIGNLSLLILTQFYSLSFLNHS